jgi:hypothetical protein
MFVGHAMNTTAESKSGFVYDSMESIMDVIGMYMRAAGEEVGADSAEISNLVTWLWTYGPLCGDAALDPAGNLTSLYYDALTFVVEPLLGGIAGTYYTPVVRRRVAAALVESGLGRALASVLGEGDCLPRRDIAIRCSRVLNVVSTSLLTQAFSSDGRAKDLLRPTEHPVMARFLKDGGMRFISAFLMRDTRGQGVRNAMGALKITLDACTAEEAYKLGKTNRKALVESVCTFIAAGAAAAEFGQAAPPPKKEMSAEARAASKRAAANKKKKDKKRAKAAKKEAAARGGAAAKGGDTAASGRGGEEHGCSTSAASGFGASQLQDTMAGNAGDEISLQAALDFVEDGFACSACSARLPPSRYSVTQFEKSSGVRRCDECDDMWVGGGGEDEDEDENDELSPATRSHAACMVLALRILEVLSVGGYDFSPVDPSPFFHKNLALAEGAGGATLPAILLSLPPTKVDPRIRNQAAALLSNVARSQGARLLLRQHKEGRTLLRLIERLHWEVVVERDSIFAVEVGPTGSSVCAADIQRATVSSVLSIVARLFWDEDFHTWALDTMVDVGLPQSQTSKPSQVCVIKYFSLYSVYVQCKSFAKLTFRSLPRKRTERTNWTKKTERTERREEGKGNGRASRPHSYR